MNENNASLNETCGIAYELVEKLSTNQIKSKDDNDENSIHQNKDDNK